MKDKGIILIVEDEVMIAQNLMMDIQDSGFDVYDYLTSGEEAIKFALEKIPDLIIMDINLAGKLDGIDAAKEITDKINIPIIFTTGYSEQNIFERAQKINPVAFLNKPVEITDLKPIIDSIFK